MEGLVDTLHDRLAELADHAPTGGAPAAELWARGKRAHRLRAAALAATLLVIGAVGAGIGVHFADGDGKRSATVPAETVGIALPIDYPVGEDLPSLGETPGPLAAAWLAPHDIDGAPVLVGLVAESGTFGTLPIELPDHPDDPQNPVPSPEVDFALSPDGRRIVYNLYPAAKLVVRDLVSGEQEVSAFPFGIRGVDGWVDATHLLGHVAAGSDGEGWVWEPGTAPRLVDFYAVPYGKSGLAIPVRGGGPWACSSLAPVLQDVRTREQNGGGWAGAFEVPVLCDVLGVSDSRTVLGHWKTRQDGNGLVVGLDIARADPQLGHTVPARPGTAAFDDPALRRVVVTTGAPGRVSLATDLIGESLAADGGAS
jgi:hypothetical protein